jgi:hypothetical protein
MKKLFTLALVLLVATMGYAQVRKVSKNDAKNKVATMQVVKDSENFENMQRRPTKTRSDGELDYTTYDWQTYVGPRTWTIVWPDGKVNFAYNVAYQEGFSDLGTGIGTYDSTTDEWIPLGGRIENEKTRFGSIARYRDNSIVVAAQTELQCGVYIVEDKDEMTPCSVPPTSYLDPTYEPSCPNVMTSGANRDIIHVVATANSAYSVPGAEDVINPIIYFRSMDGGETWDKENVILPYMGSEGGLFWGSHVCYWMETTEDNCLALVVNNPWSDGMVIYSYDDGETWERKVFYHHPGINTTFENWFMYPRWVSAQWGMDGELCLAYEFNSTTGEPGSGSYDPSVGGVAFWSETMPYHGENPGGDPNTPLIPSQPFIMDYTYINDLWNSSWYFGNPSQVWPEYFGYVPDLGPQGEFNIEDFSLHGDYHCGPVAMPVLAMVPGSNGSKMVAVWCSMDENNMDWNGNYYFKLFGSYSNDGGRTWTPQIQLTKDFMWSLNEFVYPQAAVIGTTLVVAVQTDEKTGSSYMNGDPDPFSWYQGFTFDITDLFFRSEWYYEIVWNDNSITYQHLEFAGDTTINNERPKVIVRSNTQYDRDTIFEVTHEYVYKENDTVYWWNRELQEFTILYDLSANVGDEWEIKVGTESLIMHVDAVRDIEYEGHTYRTLTVSDPENLFSGDIVCGIGHLTSFFPEKLMNRGKGFRVEGLRCYWEEGELVFKIGEEDCDAIFWILHGVEEDSPSTGLGTSETLMVYPNPTNGVLFVETRRATSLPTEQGYRITNLMGQTLLQGHITDETQQIDIANLPAGMYFISVGEETVKFVVR